MGRRTSLDLPHFTSAERLSDNFSTFFMNKVANTRNNINSDSPPDADNITMNKSCDLDPLPTWLLKKCIDKLLMTTAVINKSVTESVMLPRNGRYEKLSTYTKPAFYREKVVARCKSESVQNNDLHDSRCHVAHGRHIAGQSFGSKS